MSPSRPLRFDALEGKLLLSGAHPHAVRAVPPLAHVVLDGTLVPQSSSTHSTPDGMSSIQLSGRLRSMGPVHATFSSNILTIGGDLQSGTIDISNARGEVHLAFGAAVNTPIPSSIVIETQYHVVSGTGAYANATGVGTWANTYATARHPGTMIIHSRTD